MESQDTKGAIQKPDARVEIQASWSTLNHVRADIVCLSEFGACLMFAESFVQHRDISSRPVINLRIQIHNKQALNDIRGRVVSARSAKDFVKLNIEFLNTQGVRSRLPEQTFASFNRRAASRAILPSNPRTTVDVLNTTRNQQLTAALMDISESGLRLLFSSPDCPDGGDRLKLTFTLPDSEYQFSLVARVIKQSCLAGVKSCGVQFSTTGEEFRSQQLKIRSYVKNRLAELAETALADY